MKSTDNGAPRLIDAHHHLWNLKALHYPWLMARGEKRFFGDPTPIQRDYGVAEFLDDIDDLPVRGSVHIQVGAAAGDTLAETRWQQNNAARFGLPSAIVAFCNLAAPDAAVALDAHLEYDTMRGVRQIVGRSRREDSPDAIDLLREPAWRAGLDLLAARGLSFDLQLRPDQLGFAREVFEPRPDLPVALCHAGSPGDAGKAGFAQWNNDLRAFSRLPNAVCKLSGFGMFDHAWTIESIRPYVHSAIDAFGPQRCMFGSNFPVDRLHTDYGDLWAAYLALIDDCSEDERDRMLYRNALAFYRLEA